jgi:hypothetical protein
MSFLTKLTPYLVQIGEALLVGIGVGYGAYASGGNLNAAILAGVAASVAKLLPAQITPTSVVTPAPPIIKTPS